MIVIVFFIVQLLFSGSAFGMESSKSYIQIGANQSVQAATKPKIFELIESDASLEEIKKEFDTDPSHINYIYGYSTALIKAARTGRENLVELLVLGGAEINKSAGADQLTPIKSAIRQRDYSMVSLLIKLGADLNGGKFYCDTPLYEALSQYNFYNTVNYDDESLDKMGKIVNLLVQKGAVIAWPYKENEKKYKKPFQMYIKRIQNQFNRQIIIYQSPETILFGNKN